MLAVLVFSGFGLIAWLAYLQFGHFLVRTTKDASCLKHGADLARGYKAA